jgi:hypothetical protein
VPAHRQAMGSKFDPIAARRHHDRLADHLSVDSGVWPVGHSSRWLHVPDGWTDVDVLNAITEALVASPTVGSITGLLRKAVISADEAADPSEAARQALAGFIAEYTDGKVRPADPCSACSYPPSLCACTESQVAS